MSDSPVSTGRKEKQIVFSLHGINTPGKWQKDFARELTEHDFIYAAPDYGRFKVFQFLIPFLRRRKYKWFVEEYDNKTRGSTRLPSIVAHSFGTLIVTEVMEKYQHVKFERIIFCGSIVRKNYDWSTKVTRGQCQRVHNDYGGVDFWAWVARFVVKEAGESGVEGFSDEANGAVSQIFYQGHHHSDYHHLSNYQRSWIPFLLGKEAHRLTDEDLKGEPRNPFFRNTMIALAVIVLAVAAVVAWHMLKPVAPVSDSITFEKLVEDHRADGFLGILDKYKAAHVGKQITWDVVIKERVSEGEINGYIVAPVDPKLSDFTVLAKFDPSDPIDWLKAGDTVKIKAIIDDINSSTVRLKQFKLAEP